MNKKLSVFVGTISVLNLFMCLILLYFRENKSAIIGLIPTQLVFTYSYFKLKRTLTIPIMILFFMFCLFGFFETFILPRLNMNEQKYDSFGLMIGYLIMGLFFYATYRNWKRGKW